MKNEVRNLNLKTLWVKWLKPDIWYKSKATPFLKGA